MFRAKAVLIGALAAGALVHPAIAGQAPQMEIVPAVSVTPDVSTLPRYTTDGGKSWTPVKEQKGIVERIPAGMSKTEFMEAHKMSPEAEAAIVQKVPPVPVIVDGVLYQPEQIHLFDGKQLGFTVGKDGKLYAFTSFGVLEAFVDTQKSPRTIESWRYSSLFFEGIGYDGPRHLEVDPGVTWQDLFGMNDIFSSMQVSPYADNDCTLFEDVGLSGLYFVGLCGTPYANLGDYGWNDRASSLVVWPR